MNGFLRAISLAIVLSIMLSGAVLGQLPWSWDGAPWADPRAFMSPMSEAVKENLQDIMAAGITLGRVEGRMGQIGDSISNSSAFFRNVAVWGAVGNETEHDYDPVRSWLAYSGNQPADESSFYNLYGKEVAYGNDSGWHISDAVAAGHPAAAVEVGDGVVPGEFSWALIMFGTNDIDDADWEPGWWSSDLADFVQAFVDLGVIPVLSTIPPEAAHVGDGRVEAANQVIRAVAIDAHIPYVDYYKLILYHQPVNWHGTLIGGDGTHPSAGGGGRDFSQDGLTTTDGYAARTKLAFDVAEVLRAIVFENGETNAVFLDGFQSGDTSAWSSTVPSPSERTLR